ncbi:MAG: excinuclease ABC subunit UvrB [bacterium]
MIKRLFELKTSMTPMGDQPKAITSLVRGLQEDIHHQTLLGVTGSGKTFTIAHVIAQVQRPTLIIAHNKTLAAQLCNEFRLFFPDNAVHYFVSYYDYYQPEAYLPTTDTYIDKEAMINDEIDKLRHAATTSLLTWSDVIIVASVSCIYGLGAPEVYRDHILELKIGDFVDRSLLMRKLVSIQFLRTTADLRRGTFRLRGDNWDIMPPYQEIIYSFKTEHNRIVEIYAVDPIKGFQQGITPKIDSFVISPARHFITYKDDREKAVKNIIDELAEQLAYFEKNGKYLEAERLERRTKADISMMLEIGYCNGIENYSRQLSFRSPGEPGATLLDYFPDDFLMVIDESHVTVPQLRGMYKGDASRKKTLIEYGFRLPSALDNRPLQFDEFEERMPQTIYTSATPGQYEYDKSGQIVEQIIRPTGLVDPKITICPAKGQVEDVIPRIRERIEKGDRILVTTLTKRMAEDLSEYLHDLGIKVNYLHSDVKTFDRIRILTGLRKGDFDVIVGVNLLREGLDLPEVSLIAILDADKEGFLRNQTSLIQTIGRAARNVEGEVILYADVITDSIKRAVEETDRRRKLQIAYNKKHGIVPKTIIKEITDIIPAEDILALEEGNLVFRSKTAIRRLISQKEHEMKEAAKALDFELAAIIRDELEVLGEKNKKLKGKTAPKN